MPLVESQHTAQRPHRPEAHRSPTFPTFDSRTACGSSTLLLLSSGHHLLVPSATRRNEHSNLLLVLLVLRVLVRRDQLRQPRAALEQREIKDSADPGPVVEVAVGRQVARPPVQRQPDGLLGRKVRVPGQGEEAVRVEAALKVRFRVARGQLAGLLVGVFGGLEV